MYPPNYADSISKAIIEESDSVSPNFADFRRIVNIIFHWLGYEFNVFGTSISIFGVIISCLILGIAITAIIKLFIGE